MNANVGKVEIEVLLEQAREILIQMALLEADNGGRLPGRFTALARTELEMVVHWLEDAVAMAEGKQ